MPIKTENFEQIEVSSREELRSWLSDNHTQKESVRLVTYKKNVPEKYFSRREAMDELLCFGWIDGIRRKLDDKRTMQLIAPRQVQYRSKTYKDRVERLTKEGLMHESGLRSVQEGKESGLWNFLDDVDALIVPDDFQEALESYPGALEQYTAFPDSAKRYTLRHIKLAKTEKTRIKRIEQAALLASQNTFIPGVRMG